MPPSWLRTYNRTTIPIVGVFEEFYDPAYTYHMNSAIRESDIGDHPVERLFGGFRLRSVSLMVLTGFLVTLFLCAFAESTDGFSEDHPGEPANHSHVAGHSDHDRGVQQAGECCTVFASVTTPTHATDFSVPKYCLLGVLLLCVAAIKIVSAASVRKQFNCAGPPGVSKQTLIANSLWPHAPPR